MAKQKQSSVPEAISASLFEVAKTLDEQRKVHQALAAYLKLIEHYPDSQEVTVATERVLAIADEFRKKGQYYVAMRVFDRLEAAHQGR
jgi:outer membrane protein assembly factor BamD (BamD/ComL family)